MALKPWQKILLEPYNRIVENLIVENLPDTNCEELRQIQEKAKARTDISSHLRAIFMETVENSPHLIVELGVKKGFSTFALSRAAMVTRAILVSVDARDFSTSLNWEKWQFVQMDDLDFAQQFPTWCSERKIKPSIDVLFIDSSHKYEHTKKEIAAFAPFFSASVKVMFHDTNCSDWYRRRNFTIDRSYDAKRGVIKAIEDYLGSSFNEKKRFVEIVNGWLIKHDPVCNGLIIMKKIIYT